MTEDTLKVLTPEGRKVFGLVELGSLNAMDIRTTTTIQGDGERVHSFASGRRLP